MTALSYIALGSNLDNPLQQVEQAVNALGQLPNSQLLKVSPWYLTPPMGPQSQPDYINGVAALETSLEPLALLEKLQAIEHDQGRARHEYWGPRTIDLDILLYGQQRIKQDGLTIPHPGIKTRNFVLYPLADIAPDLILPDGTQLQQLLENNSADGMVQLSTANTGSFDNSSLQPKGYSAI